MDTLVVKDVGTEAEGASKSRFVLTDAGMRHVKFQRSDGEGPHSLVNEVLVIELMSRLGVERPRPSLARLPAALRSAPEFAPVTDPIGIAIPPLFSVDLRGPMIAEAARSAPCSELVAQYMVLDWVRSGDHRGKNFILTHGSVLAIDFSAAPPEEVWDCKPFQADTPDHGSMADVVMGCEASEVQKILERFDQIGAAELRAIFAGVPSTWASVKDIGRLVEKLVARKEEVRERYDVS